MSDSLRKKVVFAVFIAALVWGFVNFRHSPKKHVTQSTVVTANEQAPHISVNGPSRQINIAEKSKEPWGNNPFHLVSLPATRNSEPAKSLYWQLSGIIFSNQSSVAIINDKPVQVGQTIDNAKVISINKDQVVLEANGVKMTLTVSQG